MTRIGVITFPGTLDDVDAARAVHLAGAEPVALWHKDADLKGVDAVVVPGGFSYGDYLRCGAIARFAPVMNEVVEAAGKGMPYSGICNGFQILAEAHLLPGALLRNDHQKFRLPRAGACASNRRRRPGPACSRRVRRSPFRSRTWRATSSPPPRSSTARG